MRRQVVPGLIFLILSGLLFLTALAGTAPQSQSANRVREVDGPEIFKNHCASCHGADGQGHGPVAGSLKKSVPDLTRIAQRNGGKFPAEMVKQQIDGTGQTPLSHGTREMPVWGPGLHQIGNDQDLGYVRLEAITKYLESIQRKKE